MANKPTDRYKRGALAICALLISMVAPSQALANKLQTANLGDCQLQSGETIRNCQLSYRIYGEAAEDGSNIVLMPTWYNGSAESLLKYGYLGDKGIVDTRHYQVIAVNAFGNGISSSPSNSRQSPFPTFSIRDMVDAQYRLLTEHLKLKHLHAVVGTSMGGHQVYEWMMQYPDFATHFVAIEGSPWPTFFDYLKERGWLSILESPMDSPEDVARANDALTAIDSLVFWTPDYVNRELGQGDFPELFTRLGNRYDENSLRDRASQTRAILQHDIRRGRDDFEQRLKAMRPVSALAIVFTDDMTVNPAPNKVLGQQLGFRVLEIDGDCGHFGPNPECYQQDVARHVNQFLDEGSHHEMLRRSLRVGDMEREYFVYRPDGFHADPLPVVFALHGYGSTATGFATSHDLNRNADKNGYMIVYPQGSHFIAPADDATGAPPYFASSWNDEASNFTPTIAGPHCTDERVEYPCPPDCGSCNRCAWVSCQDDSDFLMQVVDAVETEFATDPGRYYLLGNSNGGTMVQRLGCDHGERFAAAVINLIQMPPGHSCGPGKAGLPMLHVYAGKDEVVGHDGTPAPNGWIFTSAAQNTRAWARSMACRGEPTQWRSALSDQHGLICSAYVDCPVPGQEVVSCQDPPSGHDWRGQRISAIPPGCVTTEQAASLPGQAECQVVTPPEPLWGMDLFWQFFQRYQRN